jgi:hypothetical protein
MVKCVIRPIKLPVWFPPHDPLAASIARLCVLREDFFLETCGIREDSVRELDKNSSGWRRIYFFRRSIRTLMEIHRGIQTLILQTEFKELLSKQTWAEQNKFKEFSKELAAAHSLIKELGNKLGAHVERADVQKALEEMQPDREGLIEVGRVVKDMHFQFAGELVLDIMKPGAPERQHKQIFKSDIRTVARLTPVLKLIDEIVCWYLVDRSLI